MILVKTEAGHQVLRDRSVRLTPRQRSAFILFDGHRSVGDVLAAGVGILREDIEQMVGMGLLGQVAGATMFAANASRVEAPVVEAPVVEAPVVAEPAPAVPEPAAAVAARTSQERYQDAYPIAARLTSGLGLRGFRLNLAVERSTSHEELLALLPKIHAAVGPDKAAELEQALGR